MPPEVRCETAPELSGDPSVTQQAGAGWGVPPEVAREQGEGGMAGNELTPQRCRV